MESWDLNSVIMPCNLIINLMKIVNCVIGYVVCACMYGRACVCTHKHGCFSHTNRSMSSVCLVYMRATLSPTFLSAIYIFSFSVKHK